jgi:hypothetical protein
MKPQGVLPLFTANRFGLILGSVIGMIVAPFLAVLGLSIGFFQAVRPILVGPMDLMGSILPNIQTLPNSYYVPAYKWILTLGFNGICYAVLGGIIQNVVRSWYTRERQA